LLSFGLPLLFLLGGHMVTDGTAPRGAEHTMVCHVACDATDDCTFDATLGVGWCGRADDQGETGGSR
jgi:hypothetical protein